MPSEQSRVIQIMRAALDDAMTKIPTDQATPAIKAQLAELILKAAAEGQTTHDGCWPRRRTRFRRSSRCS